MFYSCPWGARLIKARPLTHLVIFYPLGAHLLTAYFVVLYFLCLLGARPLETKCVNSFDVLCPLGARLVKVEIDLDFFMFCFGHSGLAQALHPKQLVLQQN